MAHRAPALLLVGALAALVLATSAAKALPPAPNPTCSPGPADCSAWHTGNVTVSWDTPQCPSATISTDGSTPVSCTASDGSGSRTTTINVRRDATPPSVTASPDRGPDNNGWYNRGVSIAFSGDDGASGVASCSSAGGYNGPDTAAVAISGTCTDNAGNTGRTSIEIRYDGTPPTVDVKPDRQPNARGWYNRQLTVAFVGSDPTSGVDSCAVPVTYKGPDAPQAAVSGTCTDKAANTSPPAGFALKYDTRPPTLRRVKAELTSRGIVLRWTASKDTLSFGIVRRPGLKGKKPSTLYTGRARVFTDRRLEKSVKYRYTVTAYDEAGNAAVKALAAQLSSSITKPAVTKPVPTRPVVTKPALTRPAAGARLAAPPLLAWTAAPKATYYNVQLYRDGRKILTVWPTSKSVLLQRSWTFGGRTYRLTPGRYSWFVWAGFGPRSANRYGKLLGTRSFVVTR